MNWHWLSLIASQTGSVLSVIRGAAPLVGIVTTAIQTAEALRGATGAQKLAHAQQLVVAGAAATNEIAGRTVIDPAVANIVAAEAISTIVDTANLIHQAHAPAPAGV